MATLTLTKSQRIVILHRLDCEAVSDCLADTEATAPGDEGGERTPEWEAAYSAAYDRFETARIALADRMHQTDGPVEVTTDDDVALMRDAFEGSTWWANVDHEEPLLKASMMRTHDALLAKFRAAFGEDVYSPIFQK